MQACDWLAGEHSSAAANRSRRWLFVHLELSNFLGSYQLALQILKLKHAIKFSTSWFFKKN